MNTNNTQETPPKFIFQVSDDGTVQPMAMRKGSAVREIPPAVYSLNICEKRGMYLQPENDFKLPPRIYGTVNVNIDRFLRSYELNNKNLGVMLIGEAGSGKTLTLKALVQKAITLDIPTILINRAWPGEMLVPFLSTISQPIIVCFDEYDKTYAGTTPDGRPTLGQEQTSMLQLLDGTTTGAKKLFIFTANDDGLISNYMKNRPSRIRYTITFNNIDLQTVVDYVTANLKNCTEEHVRAFVHLALAENHYRARGLNFDTMCELVTEMNQFDNNLNECMALMSTKGIASNACFNVDVYQDGTLINTGTGRATHKGCYVGKDGCLIDVSMVKFEDEDKFIKTKHVERLTEEHFQGFGNSHSVIEFKKDNLTYICTYTSYHETQLIHNKQDVEIAKTQPIDPDAPNPCVGPEYAEPKNHSTFGGGPAWNGTLMPFANTVAALSRKHLGS